MNDARMTIRIPGSSLAFARRYASEMGVTVTDLVVRYFDRMKAAFASDDVLWTDTAVHAILET